MLSGDHLHESSGGAEFIEPAPDKPKRILSSSEEAMLSHHAGQAVRHQHNFSAPIDQKADLLLREGALDDVISLAELAPARVAEAMARNRLVLDHFHDHSARDLLLRKTWDSLAADIRDLETDRMVQYVVERSRRMQIRTRRRDGRAIERRFEPGDDEIAIDQTVDNLVAVPLRVNGRPVASAYSSIVVSSRARRPCAYALMIDESRSMRGSKALAAALSAAALLLNVDPRDKCAVVAFSEKSRRIRPLMPAMAYESVIRHLLDVRPDGCTDLAAGVRAGAKALQGDRHSRHVGILVTDGWINTGADPLALANEFERLHVIELPAGDPLLCEQMARRGNGRRFCVKDIGEIPRAVWQCLSAA